MNTSLPIPQKKLTPKTSTSQGIRPVVTLSRAAGAGGVSVARKLLDKLNALTAPNPWNLYDLNLIDQVLKEHELPAYLAQLFPEDALRPLELTSSASLGFKTTARELVRSTEETIHRIAQRGNAVIVGRGAHAILEKHPYTFHVRLVGTPEKRVKHLMEHLGLNEEEAVEKIEQEDTGRSHYLRTYYHHAIDDPTHYHLTLNTDRISYEVAAQMIAAQVAAMLVGE